MDSFWEIVIFAIIALVLVTALIDMLGKVDESETSRSKSFFGERVMEEVFDIDGQITVNKTADGIERFKDIVHASNYHDKLKIINELCVLINKLPTFKPLKFIDNASKAAGMIIEALKKNDQEVLEHLIDKRFLSNLNPEQHKSLSDKESKIISAKISDIYQFGHTIFIKIMFDLSCGILEEWSFTKSMLSHDNIWQVNSISSI
ncbi:hypothetical protein phytr_1570 [Candidatus Phycorickettsia trachydisci]|uniref:Tim44-like domain-containing protein n=1 Tax=Candidatus Phycorickettsia trachydisci TaxID=2115978 RepID=A0A2P1P784_9RICK|nr:hypothetical protein [Candidatus Phycorickettsia trachydisci]AVP87116.1 hypothetical protein phytr_1570 [Candidatus Phycorickettsia trachydisci]